MGSKCRMQRRKPFGEKILEIRGNPALLSGKIFHYFWIPTSQSTTNLKKSKTAQELRFSFYKKKKSKAISLKSHIRGRNPLYRRKPEFGKKVLGIQGNQPCPAKKSSHYFLDSHQRNPAFFQKPKTAPKLRFSVLGGEKKGKAISLKYHIRGRNPVYRRKPEFGKKIREIQGNQLCPVEKKFPIFLNSHQRKPRLFSKSQNGDEITVLRFFF